MRRTVATFVYSDDIRAIRAADYAIVDGCACRDLWYVCTYRSRDAGDITGFWSKIQRRRDFRWHKVRSRESIAIASEIERAVDERWGVITTLMTKGICRFRFLQPMRF